MEIPQSFLNLNYGSGYGTELAFNLLPVDPWRLGLSYSYLELDLKPGEGSLNPGAENPEGSFPQNQLRAQSLLELSKRLELDAFLYYVDELPAQGTPSYTRLDLRFGFRPTDALEIAVVGQNLFDEQHPEFAEQGLPMIASRVERSVFLQFRWRY